MSLLKLKVLVIGMGAVIVFLFLAIIFIPSNKDKNSNKSSEKLNVVATFFPLYDFTRNVAGDLVDLELLFQQSPHVSSFKPSDVAKINNADVVLINGIGFEPILEDILKASDNNEVKIIDTSKGIELIKNNNAGISDNEVYDDGSFNPHIWLDPNLAEMQVANIRDGLMAIDAKNSETYDRNAKTYIQKLRDLDRKIKTSADSFIRREIIVFHPAFSYFAKRYDINQVAFFESSPGKETTPAELLEISNKVKDLGITALFTEPQSDSKIVKTIARDLGVEVRQLNTAETGSLESDSYIEIMEKNLIELESVLK